jgi:hypothetical protein
MIKKTLGQDKVTGLCNPYKDRLGIIHIIDDDTRWSGKLIAIVGENLLFEKKTGVRVLVDPTAIGHRLRTIYKIYDVIFPN